MVVAQGNNQLFTRIGAGRNGFLAAVARRLKASPVLFFGRFGLPVPYRTPMVVVVGQWLPRVQMGAPSDLCARHSARLLLEHGPQLAPSRATTHRTMSAGTARDATLPEGSTRHPSRGAPVFLEQLLDVRQFLLSLWTPTSCHRVRLAGKPIPVQRVENPTR